MKHFNEGLEIILRKFVRIRLIFPVLLIAPRKLETVTTCSRFIRALIAACLGWNSVYKKNICTEKKTYVRFSLLSCF